ncbi:nicotinamide-nucleotide adenylyltransferase [Candidatus Gracilibacteria bacterium]|nr:nicotinamide-nucleotide adenylyltransferase [Candidatus Gracilibacteria bacterium]
MQSALFIGRFQPFHLGHLDVVKKIIEKHERVIIAIGSAEKNFLPLDPLTSGERFQIIEESLREAKIPAEKYCIIPVVNLNNYALWVNHINTFLPPYTHVFTGSKLVKACFKKTKNGPEIFQLKRELKISATLVRESIMKGKKWEKLVPPACAKLLKTWNIKDRLNDIN